MASDWQVTTDAIVDELCLHVPTFAQLGSSLQRHLYAPWDPEELQADGRKHLAVWPRGEAQGEAETPEPLAIGMHELHRVFRVLYWEPGEAESARQRRDEKAAAALLQLHNDIRARFYVTANQNLGGNELAWYAGCRFPERSGRVRWMEISLAVSTGVQFS